MPWQKLASVIFLLFNFSQVTLSGRDVEKGLSVRTSRVQISTIPSNEAEGSLVLTVCSQPDYLMINTLSVCFRPQLLDSDSK